MVDLPKKSKKSKKNIWSNFSIFWILSVHISRTEGQNFKILSKIVFSVFELPKNQKKLKKKILVIFGIYTTFLDFDDLFLANGASKTENKYQNRIPHVRITQKVENAAENLFF